MAEKPNRTPARSSIVETGTCLVNCIHPESAVFWAEDFCPGSDTLSGNRYRLKVEILHLTDKGHYQHWTDAAQVRIAGERCSPRRPVTKTARTIRVLWRQAGDHSYPWPTPFNRRLNRPNCRDVPRQSSKSSFCPGAPSSSSSSLPICGMVPGGGRLSNRPAARNSLSPGRSRALSSPK